MPLGHPLVLLVSLVLAQAGTDRIPLTTGLVLVSALHFPDGDRENVVTVEDASPDGVTYAWHVASRTATGTRGESFTRFVRAADLAGAPRLNTVFLGDARADSPGYTAFTLSTAVYSRLRASGETPFTVTDLSQSDAFGGALSGLATGVPALLRVAPRRVALKGSITLVSRNTEAFPLLLDGIRTAVPVLRVRGRFAFQEQHLEQEFWVLADSAHPLILKAITGRDTLQMVRIERARDVQSSLMAMERALASTCRMEIWGAYFGFGDATLDAASNRVLTTIADVLRRHDDWTLSIEGHTDSIGTARANQDLSARRAEAVRAGLAAHGIDQRRLRALGHGASSPRESNSTLAGRARNRRVELVRPCAATK